MKRKLRPSIRVALTAITIMLGMFFACIDDFSMSALPFLAMLFGIMILNVKVLEKF